MVTDRSVVEANASEPLPRIYDDYTDEEIDAMERKYLAEQQWRTDIETSRRLADAQRNQPPC